MHSRGIKVSLLFSSKGPEVLELLNVSTLFRSSLEVSKLHKDVWEVFLLGGGHSKELSESIAVKHSSESDDSHTSRTLLTCMFLSDIASIGTLFWCRYLNKSSFLIFLLLSRSDIVILSSNSDIPCFSF